MYDRKITKVKCYISNICILPHMILQKGNYEGEIFFLRKLNNSDGFGFLWIQ